MSLTVGKFRHCKESDKIISRGWATANKNCFREIAFEEYFFICFVEGEILPAFLLLICPRE